MLLMVLQCWTSSHICPSATQWWVQPPRIGLRCVLEGSMLVITRASGSQLHLSTCISQAEVPDGEPLAVAGVRFAPGAAHALASEWAAAMEQRAHPSPPLFDTADQFVQLVVQTLSRDIRSAHQRQRSPVMAQAGESAAADPQPEADELQPARGQWRVILDAVNVGYSLDDGGCVTITDAHIHIAVTDEQAILSETV